MSNGFTRGCCKIHCLTDAMTPSESLLAPFLLGYKQILYSDHFYVAIILLLFEKSILRVVSLGRWPGFSEGLGMPFLGRLCPGQAPWVVPRVVACSPLSASWVLMSLWSIPPSSWIFLRWAWSSCCLMAWLNTRVCKWSNWWYHLGFHYYLSPVRTLQKSIALLLSSGGLQSH